MVSLLLLSALAGADARHPCAHARRPRDEARLVWRLVAPFAVRTPRTSRGLQITSLGVTDRLWARSDYLPDLPGRLPPVSDGLSALQTGRLPLRYRLPRLADGLRPFSAHLMPPRRHLTSLRSNRTAPRSNLTPPRSHLALPQGHLTASWNDLAAAMDHLTDSRNDFAVAIDRLSGWGDHLRGANSGLSRAASYSTGPPDACAPVPTGSRRTQHRLCGAPSGPRRG